MAEGAEIRSDSLPTYANGAAIVFWLQGLTLAWMLVELAVSIYAAVSARSPAMLAFGSDSLVELLSAAVVLLQFVPQFSLSEHFAARAAAVLLSLLAFVVGLIASASLFVRQRPDVSRAGIGITLAALVVMPILAWLKRREFGRNGNRALAADSVQSAACAYLALVALVGVGVNAIFHLAWFDPLAALAAVPILVQESRSTWKGHGCGCC